MSIIDLVRPIIDDLALAIGYELRETSELPSNDGSAPGQNDKAA